jgi:IPT/TIG domain
MSRRVLVLICALAAALALPASASAARLPKAPVITSVSPLRLAVGDTLTIRGRHFIPGRLKNTVVFQRVRARAVFVRADNATATQIKLRVPAKLLPFLSQRGGSQVVTRFRLRVLARRFGLAFTPMRLSPLIGPTGTGRAPGLPAPITGVADCDRDGVPNSAEADDDNDLLLDAEEVPSKYRTDPCNPDSDLDTVEDGYEVHAALDLNSRALPYPGKRPYPNALDGSDSGIDYDGDGLLQREEYSAFIRYFPHALASNGRLPAYSDGDQTTGGPLSSPVPGAYPIPPGGQYLNTDGSCDLPTFNPPCIGRLFLSDDELDVDGDGIGNWDEIRGAFAGQRAEHIAYKPLLDFLDPDTDGDTVPDGPDDQDHDDVSNVDELQDPPAGTTGYAVDHRFDATSSNAMDPCDPDINSRSCPLHPE